MADSVAEEFFTPELRINAEVSLTDLNQTFYNILSQMEPFGPENSMPVFVARGVKNDGRSKIVKEKHIRFSLSQRGRTITGIGFNMLDKFDIVQLQKPFDIVFTLDENEWNNEKTLQLKVIDLQESAD